jgi:hypothetical protein
VLRAATGAAVRRWRHLHRRLYTWQVGRFIRDPQRRATLVPRLYEQFIEAEPAFWRLNEDLLGAIWSRRRRIADGRTTRQQRAALHHSQVAIPARPIWMVVIARSGGRVRRQPARASVRSGRRCPAGSLALCRAPTRRR